MPKYQRGGFSDDDPRSNLPEIEATFDRLPYAPTPLNPYDLSKDGTAYIKTAIDRTYDLFNAFLDAKDADLSYSLSSEGEIKKETPSQAVVNLMELSITSALFRRFENNSHKTIPPDCDAESARLFKDACLGKASPEDLIELLSRHAGDLRSLELAKQTHPFVWEPTAEMDRVVTEALDHHGFEEPEDNPENVQYFYNRVDDIEEARAVVVVRKADIGMKKLADGSSLVAVRRDCFVIDLVHADALGVRDEIVEWLANYGKQEIKGTKKTRYKNEKLINFVGSQLEMDASDRSAALCPGVCSYYVRHESGDSTEDSFAAAEDEFDQ